jgi:indole-3-glycerol phosphate synthase
VTVVAESGVRGRADVELAALAGADAVLVGETLMRAPFPEDVLAELTGVAKAAR